LEIPVSATHKNQVGENCYTWNGEFFLRAINRTGFLTLMIAVICLSLFGQHFTARARDFGERDIAIINIAVPAVMAAIRAYHENEPIEKAFIQAAFGGYIMQEGFRMAPKLEEKSAIEAWKAKIMVNLGASIAESAGDKFTFRMDIGPVWMIADGKTIKFRPGLNGVVAPVVHLLEGSQFDLSKSLKYGTTSFKREVSREGTLMGTSALAYSNANTFTTNTNGSHAGHEMVHTFQYRREAMYPLRIGNLFPEIDKRLGDAWVDDTAWSISWGLQCAWAEHNKKSKDFDILMEKEAYYLEAKYRLPYRLD